MTRAKKLRPGFAWRVVALCVGAAPLAGVPAQQPVPPDAADAYRYTVQPGDNLYTIAAAYLQRAGDYRTIGRMNHVRRPLRLPIGGALLLPRALLRGVPLRARVVAFRGQVEADGQAVTRATTIGEGALVETRANAFVSLALADGSTITLPSASRVRVTRLRRLVVSGELERTFRLEAGRGQLSVTPRHLPGDRFQITTPLSVAAVRGTEFRVAILDDGRAAATEVLEGVVAVDATVVSGTASIRAGMGARTTATGTDNPVPLLPAPALADPGHAQSAPTVDFALTTVSGAVRYRAQIAADAGFLDVLAESGSPGPLVSFPGLPNGDYFVRVTAIDASELEGLPRTYDFERALNGVKASASAAGGRRFLFRWLDIGDGPRTYRFLLQPKGGGPPLVDEAGLTGRAFAVTALPPGDYVWRVQTSGVVNGRLRADWGAPQTLTIAGAARR